VFLRMFAPRACAKKGCNRPALSGSPACIVHTPDAAGHVAGLVRRVGGNVILRDLDLAGIRLEDVDLSHAEISGCRLTAATFVRVKLASARIHLSFLDRATFEDCDFSQAVMQNSVFAGSRLLGCDLQDSEIVQVNFLGIQGTRIRFDHSNLYGSRFIGAVLESVSMRDCNLTRTFFDLPHRDAVDFHSSNTAEAVFQEQPA
jgi:uncharacterized protein YjbI with pentapeptide repeats